MRLLDCVATQGHDMVQALGAQARALGARALGTRALGEQALRHAARGAQARGTATRQPGAATQLGGLTTTRRQRVPGRACAHLGVLAGLCVHIVHLTRFLDSVLFLSHFLITVHHKKFSKKIKIKFN